MQKQLTLTTVTLATVAGLAFVTSQKQTVHADTAPRVTITKQTATTKQPKKIVSQEPSAPAIKQKMADYEAQQAQAAAAAEAQKQAQQKAAADAAAKAQAQAAAQQAAIKAQQDAQAAAQAQQQQQQQAQQQAQAQAQAAAAQKAQQQQQQAQQQAATPAPATQTTTATASQPSDLRTYVLNKMVAATGQPASTWDYIINRESRWTPTAQNSSSTAHGLFQSLWIGQDNNVDDQINDAIRLYKAAGMSPWAL